MKCPSDVFVLFAVARNINLSVTILIFVSGYYYSNYAALDTALINAKSASAHNSPAIEAYWFDAQKYACYKCSYRTGKKYNMRRHIKGKHVAGLKRKMNEIEAELGNFICNDIRYKAENNLKK